MAFITNQSKHGAERSLFEERLTKCKLTSKVFKNYTTWYLTSYLIIRTFEDGYSIHTNGDIDHFKVLAKSYKNVLYECSDYKFLLMLLMESTKVAAKHILENAGQSSVD